MTIPWDEKFNVGITEIDRQHKCLLDIINSLNEVQDSREIASIFKKIGDYVTFHFDYEEQLMVKYKYNGTRGHVLEHNRLKELYVDIIRQNNGLPGAKIAFNILLRWFVTHTTSPEMDKKLGQFLINFNVK